MATSHLLSQIGASDLPVVELFAVRWADHGEFMRDMGAALLEDGNPCMHDLNRNALGECIFVCLRAGAAVIVRDANSEAARSISLLVDVVGSKHHRAYGSPGEVAPVRVVLEGWTSDVVWPEAARTLDGRPAVYKLSRLGHPT